jgi:hypothetical protein
VVDPEADPPSPFSRKLEEHKEPMIAAGEAVLLGDVGATNARFAVLFDEMLGQSNGSRLPIIRRSTAR